MQKWLCFAIMDKKVGAFERPFFAKHVAEVSRSIQQQINKGDTGFALYPEDFALYLIGEFGNVDGEFISDRPQHMLELSSLVPVGG